MPSLSRDDFLSILRRNKRETDGHIYTVPSPENYPYQWLWDSCFHAIVLSHLDIEWAKQELLSLVSKQFENGMIPHMIYWVPGNKIQIKWGKKDTSSITQPPIIADAALKIYQTDSDVKFLRQIYPSLKKFYLYLIKERDWRGHHLIGIINPDESGEDNSPRFDTLLHLPPGHTLDENFQQRLVLIDENTLCHFDAAKCMKNFFWAKDVPFNALMVKNLKSMSQLALALNLEADRLYFCQQEELIKKAMRKYMYEDGLYWSVYNANYNFNLKSFLKDKLAIAYYQKIKVKSWAIFAPLYARLLSAKEAADLINRHLLNGEEFWLPFGIPSVSKDEVSFDPEGFWRGPTWISTNWFILQGLLSYGYLDLAQKILEISRGLIEKNGFREHFNPLTGKGLGAKDFTWGTLVLDMEESFKKFLQSEA